MPSYDIGSKTFEISRAGVITDTNLFVEAFLPNSTDYELANYFLEESTEQWLIPISVIIEVWGQLVGSNGNRTAGLNFLDWLNTPGKELLIIGHDGEIVDEREIIKRLQVDCVDSMILTLASKIYHQCRLEEPLRVATSDLQDFLRLGGQGIPFRFYDWREGITQDMY